MAVTRIKNNQITDSTIEYTKIAPGTLVGSVFNSNLTLNSNVSIIGNLTVTGTSSTVNSTNTYVNDPVVVFNNGYTGSLTNYDIGILINRNLSPLPGYGSVNTAWTWDEASGAFQATATTDTGTGITTLNNSGFANVRVGNLTAVSSALQTLTVSGATALNGATNVNNTLEVSGIVSLTNSTNSTTHTNGALVVTGGVGVGGNVNVFGNITTATGNIITTSAGFFIGNTTTGFGALYAGIPSGYTALPQLVSQFSENFNGYTQINTQNINAGDSATTDYVATANHGTDTTYYVDLGIAGSGYDPLAPENSLGTSLAPGDSYLYAQGNTSITPGGNLVIGTNTVGRVVRIISGGPDAANIVATFNRPGLQSTSISTGSFIVSGGVATTGSNYFGSDVIIAGNLTVNGDVTTVNTATLDVEDINITVAKGAGSAAAANGAGLTVDGASATLLYVNSNDSWTVNKDFRAPSAAITNSTASTSTSSGALIVTGGVGIGGAIYAGSIQSTPIVGGSLNNSPVGASTPNTGAFTTLSSSTAFYVSAATASTTSNTGAAVIAGGLGVGGVATIGGNLVAASTTDSTSTTTGSFIARGGAGIAGNVFAGKAATFNSSQTSGMDFKVFGTNTTNLIWAKPGSYDQVMIGNTATVSEFVSGAKFHINSTDSMILPVGTSAQRPGSAGGTDAVGMLRYNTTLNSIEYYGGSTPGWNTVSTQFTVIADEQFNGDGVTTQFTLTNSQTTNSCIVSINGVIQIPTLAYSVSGTTLTFTEAPASGDLIDVRKLTTTATITQIASQNGFDVIEADNNGLQFYSGASAQTLQYTLDTSGAWVTRRANTAVASANTPTAIDSFATATYRSAKYVIQASIGGQYQVMEALVVHDDTTPTVVTYGVVQTNGNLGVLTTGISAGTLTLNFVASNANTNVRVSKEYIVI